MHASSFSNCISLQILAYWNILRPPRSFMYIFFPHNYIMCIFLTAACFKHMHCGIVYSLPHHTAIIFCIFTMNAHRWAHRPPVLFAVIYLTSPSCKFSDTRIIDSSTYSFDYSLPRYLVVLVLHVFLWASSFHSFGVLRLLLQDLNILRSFLSLCSVIWGHMTSVANSPVVEIL